MQVVVGVRSLPDPRYPIELIVLIYHPPDSRLRSFRRQLGPEVCGLLAQFRTEV